MNKYITKDIYKAMVLFTPSQFLRDVSDIKE